jgi:hypothetical protein
LRCRKKAQGFVSNETFATKALSIKIIKSDNNKQVSGILYHMIGDSFAREIVILRRTKMALMSLR